MVAQSAKLSVNPAHRAQCQTWGHLDARTCPRLRQTRHAISRSSPFIILHSSPFQPQPVPLQPVRRKWSDDGAPWKSAGRRRWRQRPPRRGHLIQYFDAGLFGNPIRTRAGGRDEKRAAVVQQRAEMLVDERAILARHDNVRPVTAQYAPIGRSSPSRSTTLCAACDAARSTVKTSSQSFCSSGSTSTCASVNSPVSRFSSTQ